MANSSQTDIWALADLETPWCLHTVVTLRVAEHMAAGKPVEDADPEALRRVLKHLAGKGVFVEAPDGTFTLNDAARQLMDPAIRLGLDLNGIGGRMAGAWSTLPSAVRAGRSMYQEQFQRSFWDDLGANPPIAESFHRLMGPEGHGIPDPGLTDWSQVQTVVDVGGGEGWLLAEILRANPHLKGTLVDLPEAVANAPKVFENAGVGSRAEVSAQSFFEPLPAGRDVYVLKKVLSNWADPEALQILRRCAEAIGKTGVLITDVSPHPSPELLMLVLVGGKGRTKDDLAALAAQAGLQIVNQHGSLVELGATASQ